MTHPISLLQKNVSILEENSDTIIQIWLSHEEVKDILHKHDVDIKAFSINYAYPVLNYFISIIHRTNKIGHCPVITQLLEYLKDKNFSVSELFLICINFRKGMINLLFQKNLMNEEMYANISFIFDANFRGVLNSFTDTITKAREESKRLYDIATKDHLTKIFNRKKFDEIFHEEVSQANITNKKLSLILFDIDFFKKVNDTYGHEKGDDVLITITQIVKKNIRSSDIFARWGGEEFVLLMPKATKANAAIKTELVRQAIESYSFESIGQVTCSFGITDYQENDTESSLFKRVDSALYVAKNNGRNRITIA